MGSIFYRGGELYIKCESLTQDRSIMMDETNQLTNDKYSVHTVILYPKKTSKHHNQLEQNITNLNSFITRAVISFLKKQNEHLFLPHMPLIVTAITAMVSHALSRSLGILPISLS